MANSKKPRKKKPATKQPAEKQRLIGAVIHRYADHSLTAAAGDVIMNRLNANKQPSTTE